MTLQSKQDEFVTATQAAAEKVLSALSDKDKANFALALLMKSTDPDAAGVIRFAANQLSELANILMREAFERECG